MDFSFFKRHPWVTGGLVLVGVFMFWKLSQRGPTYVSSGGGGVSDASNAAAAATQIAQLQANVATSQGNMQLQALDMTLGAKLEATRIAAMSKLAELTSAENIGLAQITQAQNDNLAQLELARIGSGSQLSLAQIAADLQKYAIGTQASTTSQLISAVTAKSAPAPAPSGGGGFDYYNTENAKAPLLQGFDASIASHIDQGQVAITKNPSGDGVIVTIPGEGSYISTNPLDTRWADYTPTGYSTTGAINFG